MDNTDIILSNYSLQTKEYFVINPLNDSKLTIVTYLFFNRK